MKKIQFEFICFEWNAILVEINIILNKNSPFKRLKFKENFFVQ